MCARTCPRVLLTLGRRFPRYVDGKLIALRPRSRAMTKATCRTAGKEWQSTDWGGEAVNDAAPADTKTQVVVTPETVKNHDMIQHCF